MSEPVKVRDEDWEGVRRALQELARRIDELSRRIGALENAR
jgi:hypothetical protein